jgi:CHASE2 domain-containing sensor protein/class 3 adenylate cyclase
MNVLSVLSGKESRAFRQRLALMAGVGFLLALVLGQLGIVERLELAVYDLCFRVRGERPADAPVVIVAINDESFTALDQNIRTWPRAEYARLIDRIAAGGPAAIGVDVAWIHAETEGGGDEALARSLERARPVILAGLIEHQEGEGYEYDRYAAPVQVLAGAADGVGLVNVALDADGVVRRVLLHRLYNDVYHPAFGYAVAQAYGKIPEGDLATPAGAGGSSDMLINFRGGPNTFPTVSMYQVLNGEEDAGVFTGQIVLIGFTTILEQDLHITPFDRAGLTPGVEVHANVVATLLNDDPIRRAPAWLGAGLGLAAVVLTGLAFWRLKPVQATAAVGGAALFYVVATFLLFAQADLSLPVASPVGLAALTVAGGLVERVLVEEREKRRIRDRFQSFMAPERLAVVLDHWGELVAEDRPEVDATVLFSDIRGFTSATETMTRQGRSGEVIRFLNHYADAMVEAIFAEQGVLDKMLGDGLLVLFGVPEPTPDHALLAVRAALRMAALVPELNTVWPLRDQRPLRIGIGIHSGPLMDGVVGRGRRVEYTVIGDAVNTASRVEDYTKQVLARSIEQEGDDGQPGATILISQATFEQIRDDVRVDSDVPPLQAKGIAEPIRVYRVLGLSAQEVG